ncbi:phage shock protein C [Pedobacter sp. UYP24]
MFQRIVTYFEKQSFGVCTYLAERFNMSISKIRLFFIYSSFLAVGFPIIFYVLAAIVLDVRNYAKKIRMRIWDV